MNQLKKLLDKIPKKQRQLLDIFLVVYLIILPLSFYFIFLSNASKNFRLDFEINFFSFIYIFLFIFLSVSFAKYYIINIGKNDLFRRVFYKINYLIILTISIILTFLILSFSIYDAYTGYPLPINGYVVIEDDLLANKIINYNTINGIYIECFNEQRERDFLLDRDIICATKVNYLPNYAEYLNKIEIVYFYRNGSQETKQFLQDKNQISNLTQIWSYPIKIDSSYDQSLTRFYFINESGKLIQTNRLWLIPPRIISQEQYLDKREKSFLLFMTAISILILSVIGSIKNLRDIAKKQ